MKMMGEILEKRNTLEEANIERKVRQHSGKQRETSREGAK